MIPRDLQKLLLGAEEMSGSSVLVLRARSKGASEGHQVVALDAGQPLKQKG